MNGRAVRVFEDVEARRASVPVMIGLVGPSGSGKTFSALRLATGIQKVTGGDIVYIDTESRRALHYADRFRFRHLPFTAPFDPLSYLEAIEHASKRGATVVIVDSATHEHEGAGGVLEMHDQEEERLSKLWNTSRDKVKMTAWQKPKSERTRMINTIMQLGISTIWCFRAKERLKVIPGRAPQELGYMPIGAPELFYEMTVACLLMPRCGGVPTWQSEEVGERATMKLPCQFEAIFRDQAPLSEDIGEAIARWAAGDAAPAEPEKVLQDTLAEMEIKGYLARLAEIGRTGGKAELKVIDAELSPRFPKGHPAHATLIKARDEAVKAMRARASAQPAT